MTFPDAASGSPGAASRVRRGGVAVVASRVRFEEKQLFAALERRRVPYAMVDDRTLQWPLDAMRAGFDVALNRSISHTRGLYGARVMEHAGVRVVNSSAVIATCGDKAETTMRLAAAGVPFPRTAVALTPDAALDAIEAIGYPVVVKPVVGSWGRLVTKANDRDAAEAILEHRRVLGAPHHQIVYVQELVPRQWHDVRVIVAGERVVGAMARTSAHWINNVARGAEVRAWKVTDDLAAAARGAARAVGGGLLAIDAFVAPDGRVVVSEVNHTMEFRGFVEATGIDVAEVVVDYVLAARVAA